MCLAASVLLRYATSIASSISMRLVRGCHRNLGTPSLMNFALISESRIASHTAPPIPVAICRFLRSRRNMSQARRESGESCEIMVLQFSIQASNLDASIPEVFSDFDFSIVSSAFLHDSQSLLGFSRYSPHSLSFLSRLVQVES